MRQEATAGIIIASSIISGRALAPIDHAIVNWKAFLAARSAWKRLSEVCGRFPAASVPMALPTPSGGVSIEGVAVSPPGESHFVAADLTFALQAGSALGVIGPSASGKSSLARAIAGVWPSARGRIRLDGAELGQWDRTALGRHIGYLPQDVELMAGTIGENISRFDPNALADDVIAAATAAGVHGMITAMKDGYVTKIGDRGTGLSAVNSSGWHWRARFMEIHSLSCWTNQTPTSIQKATKPWLTPSSRSVPVAASWWSSPTVRTRSPP